MAVGLAQLVQQDALMLVELLQPPRWVRGARRGKCHCVQCQLACLHAAWLWCALVNNLMYMRQACRQQSSVRFVCQPINTEMPSHY